MWKTTNWFIEIFQSVHTQCVNLITIFYPKKENLFSEKWKKKSSKYSSFLLPITIIRQACAIESAARLNPTRDIFVIFASPVGVKDNEMLPQFYNKLQTYGNVHVRNMNLWRYSFETPLFDWLKGNKLFDSAYLFEHMSDIVRAMTLYKYGGYHIDLDVIFQKNIDDLGEDFIGDDWSTVVNGAVIHFNNYGIGREISKRFFGYSFVFLVLFSRIETNAHYDRMRKKKQISIKWIHFICMNLFRRDKKKIFPTKRKKKIETITNNDIICIFREVITNFNGTSFIANGPKMLTRILEEICSTENRTLWTRRQCHGITIHPKETFYPISWSNYTLYFEPDKMDEVLKIIENATVIHVWNDRSKDIWNKIGGNNAYQVVAERNCPLVYFDSDYFWAQMPFDIALLSHIWHEFVIFSLV